MAASTVGAPIDSKNSGRIVTTGLAESKSRRSAIFSMCPLKGVIGDYKKDAGAGKKPPRDKPRAG
jgi:hypothetical protein